MLNKLLKRHNELVLTNHKYDDLDSFTNYIYQEGNFVDRYIELPKYQTISGHAELLDLEDYIASFNFGA